MRFDSANVKSFWAQVAKGDGCWLWQGAQGSKGRGSFVAVIDEVKQSMTPARFSWMIKNGAIARGMQVCHTCDRSACVRPTHLWLGTARENWEDAVAKGRVAQKKLSSGEVARLQEKLKDPKVKIKDLAVEFGVSRSAIRQNYWPEGLVVDRRAMGLKRRK